MKKILFAMVLLTACFTVAAQNYKISWGEELKLKKGTSDLEIVAADNTGYYFIETKLAGKMFSFGSPYYNTYKLIKFNNQFEQEFDESYKSELKGLDFLSFQPLNNDLYLFATDYIKKEKSYKVYGTTIDKSNGKLNHDFTELGSYEIESKKDDFQAKLTKINNGKNFLLVSDLTGKDNTRLAVTLLDGSLNQKSTTNITLEYQPGFFALQDVKLVNNNIVLLGKSFEEAEGKKKRKKKIFKSFILSIYDLKGKKLKDIPLNVENKFTLEGKLLELPNNELALAGFFSNDGKKKTLNGFFIDKIDIAKGELTLSSTKEISANMIGQNVTDDNDSADDDDDSKKDKTNKAKALKDDDVEEFPNEFTIKSIDVSPEDGSFIIAAEISQVNSYTYTTYQPGTGTGFSSGRWTTNYVYDFINKDLLVICADKNGAIKWLNAVPKKQLETIRTSSSAGMGLSFGYNSASFFANSGGMPFYSSFKSTMLKDKYVILYNDNKNNTEVASYNDKVKTIANFKKRGEMYGLSFDIATGKTTRKAISACSDDDVITMPRHSFVVGNAIIVPAWRQKIIGKTIFKIAKVSMQ